MKTRKPKSDTMFPIFLSDRNDPQRVVKIEESTDGEGIIVVVRDAEGSARRYYPYSGGAWNVSADGTLGRQLIGTRDVQIPRDEAGLRRFFHEASSQDV